MKLICSSMLASLSYDIRTVGGRLSRGIFQARRGQHRAQARLPVLPGKHRISLEIKMMVMGAGGIEGGAAVRAAGIAMQIFVNGQFPFAGAAQNGGLMEFGAGPDGNRVVGQGDVAVLAGVVETAAVHLDGDDVDWRVEVGAAGLRIEVKAADRG